MITQITMDGEVFQVKVQKGGLCVSGLNKSKTLFSFSPTSWDDGFIVDLASNLAEIILVEVRLDALHMERKKLLESHKSS